MNLKGLIVGIGVIVCFYALWWVYARLAYREAKPDELGRYIIKPGFVSWALGLFSAALFLLFASSTILALIGRDENPLFFLLLGPPLSALMAFSAFIIFWARLRVGDTSVEYRGLRGWQKFEWDQVICVDAHYGLGPRLNIANLRPKYFWPYGYGAEAVATLFAMHEKPFALQ
jgi:hypothetical protein